MSHAHEFEPMFLCEKCGRLHRSPIGPAVGHKGPSSAIGCSVSCACGNHLALPDITVFNGNWQIHGGPGRSPVVLVDINRLRAAIQQATERRDMDQALAEIERDESLPTEAHFAARVLRYVLSKCSLSKERVQQLFLMLTFAATASQFAVNLKTLREKDRERDALEKRTGDQIIQQQIQGQGTTNVINIHGDVDTSGAPLVEQNPEQAPIEKKRRPRYKKRKNRHRGR